MNTLEKVVVNNTQADEFIQVMREDMPTLTTALNVLRNTTQGWTVAASSFQDEDLVFILQAMVDNVTKLRGLSVERFVKFLKVQSEGISIVYNKKSGEYQVKLRKDAEHVRLNSTQELQWWSADLNHEGKSSSDVLSLEDAVINFIKTRQKKSDSFEDLGVYFNKDALELVADVDNPTPKVVKL